MELDDFASSMHGSKSVKTLMSGTNTTKGKFRRNRRNISGAATMKSIDTPSKGDFGQTASSVITSKLKNDGKMTQPARGSSKQGRGDISNAPGSVTNSQTGTAMEYLTTPAEPKHKTAKSLSNSVIPETQTSFVSS